MPHSSAGLGWPQETCNHGKRGSLVSVGVGMIVGVGVIVSVDVIVGVV